MKSRLNIAGTDVAFFNELPIRTTMSVADVREMDKRQASWSYTVSIPGTPEVNALFEFIFDVNSVGNNFNPNISTDASYFVNEVRVFKGSLQLLKITTKMQENVTQNVYECAILGQDGNIFLAIAGLYLTDIDFSDLNHTLTLSSPAISDPKFAAVLAGSGYIYPFIDYGLGEFAFQVPVTAHWDITKLKPAIFEKEYLLRIFRNAGYTWSNTSYFNGFDESRIVIPCVKAGALQISAAAKANSAFRAGLTATSTQTTVGTLLVGGASYLPTSRTPVLFNNDSSGSNFDPSGSFNTGTSIFTVPTTAYYDVVAAVNINLTITPPALTATYLGTFALDILIQKSVNGGSTWSNVGGGTFTIPVSGLGTLVQTIATGYQAVANSILSNTSDLFRVVMNNQSGFIVFRNGASAIITAGSTSVGINITGGTSTSSSVFGAQILRADLPYGGTVVMNDTVPENVTQLDFLTSIIKCEYLHMELDKSDPTMYHIHTREDFYDYTDILDWTDKVAVDRDIEIIPMGDLGYGRYKWTYKQDQDFYNKLYFDSYNEVYGTQIKDVGNDFLKDEKVIEVVFSPTPVATWNNSKVVAPRFYQMVPDQASGFTFVKPQKVNIRRLYYGGIVYDPFAVCGITFGSSTEAMPGYPYAGDVGNPYVPVTDLNFGIPKTLFWKFTGQQYTTNTRYNERYSKWFSEITDRDSKSVKLWVRLTENDIATFSFRKVVWIIDAYYLVNVIHEYSPQESELTLVELLKLKKGATFVPNTSGVDQYDSVGNTGSSNRSTSGGLSIGNGNYNGGYASLISGTDNFIGDGATRVNLINCTNVNVSGQTENFTGAHLSGEDIDQNNSDSFKVGVVIDAPIKARTVTKLDTFNASQDYNVYHVDATSLNIRANLQSIYIEQTFYKIDSSANYVRITPDTGTINGQPYLDITTQWRSLTVTFNGTDYTAK